MKIATIHVLVSRDKMTKVPKVIWPWELAVIEQKFPDGLVEVLGEGSCEIESLPDADTEFIRLSEQYGSDERTGQTHMERCYGVGKAGMDAFGKAINGGPAKAKVKAKKKVKTEDESKPGPIDPLS